MDRTHRSVLTLLCVKSNPEQPTLFMISYQKENSQDCENILGCKFMFKMLALEKVK